MFNILVLHGPNLNLLASREPNIYGNMSMADIDQALVQKAQELHATCKSFQSNHEGMLVDIIHAERNWAHGILINAASLTHTSIALHDAIRAVALPCVEVHLSNVYQREAFRHHSYIAPAAIGVICGFKWQSYLLGLQGLLAYLQESKQ